MPQAPGQRFPLDTEALPAFPGGDMAHLLVSSRDARRLPLHDLCRPEARGARRAVDHRAQAAAGTEREAFPAACAVSRELPPVSPTDEAPTLLAGYDVGPVEIAVGQPAWAVVWHGDHGVGRFASRARACSRPETNTAPAASAAARRGSVRS